MHENVSDWIGFHALWTPQKIALSDLKSTRQFTYLEMNERCSRLAAFLSTAQGITRGDRVAVLAQNSSDIFEVQFACMKLGAIFVPLNWRLAKTEVLDILVNSEAKVLIYGAEFETVAESSVSSGAVKTAIRTSNGARSEYENGISAAEPFTSTIMRSMDDVWMIMYTSGTTGRPKGVMITYRMASFTGIHGMLKASVTQDSCGLTFLPLFHVGGLFIMANMIFHAGGRNVVMEKFDAAAALQALTDPELGVSHAFGVPTNFLMMAQEPLFKTADLTSLRCLLVGGAPSPATLLEAYAQKAAALQQGWGMTETASIGTVLSTDNAVRKLGSVGRPLPYIEVDIVDESGNSVSPGQIGELVVRGPTVTPGYWQSPEETAKAFRNGWFLTGDAARQDEEGFFFIVDRWKDMFISGGENVYPAEIENLLHRINGVLEAAVVGVPDECWGEVGCAYLHVEPLFSLTEQDVIRHCSSKLARFKLPKFVKFVKELPHTAAGKIAKPVLRKWFTDGIAT
jgi:fatty-acyl-CoA synthase